MIRCALCDDEVTVLDNLAARLTAFWTERQSPCQIERFTGGGALLAGALAFDVLFLDIKMGCPDGMETARLLRARGYTGLLLFVSALPEHVFDSFEVQAFDFLVKPVDDGHFRRAMNRVALHLERERGSELVVQRGGACHVIPFSRLTYCEVMGRKVYFHHQGGEVIDCYERLEALEQRLDSRFFRCHRSYLINLDYVRGYRDGLVTLWEGDAVPVSRLREQALTQALLCHMRERRH